MSDAVWVLDYLQEVVGSHRFGGEGKDASRNNFEYEIERSITLECIRGNQYAIPTGSILVVYRNPVRMMHEEMTVACFHHCGGQAQTVVMGGGNMRTSQLGNKSVYGYSRPLRRFNPLQID